MISSSTRKCSLMGQKYLKVVQIYNINIITWDFPISDGLHGKKIIKWAIIDLGF